MNDVFERIRQTELPYPQKRQLELEIAADAEFAPQAAELTEKDLRELDDLHATLANRWFRRSGHAQRYIETAIILSPLIVTIHQLSKEGKMFEFIHEGGTGMYSILAIGAVLIIHEMRHIFRLLILKSHSKENLRLDTPSVLSGSLALVFLGVGWTMLGLYISAGAALREKTSLEILLTGAKESLAPITLSLLIAGFVVLAHYATRRVLRVWQAPIAE